ncbi:Protein kinase domain [Macleaya cordata]|uniref:Protein kinase domain n=1 Tax=Macleaya cordata TaxID=56857 RepID=A0A200R8C8_MACCD|nr:Protein kinase domain [Macleaya cordata]
MIPSTTTLQDMLVYLLPLMVLLAPAAESAATLLTNSNTSIAKPGCRDRCGKVSIPYPFGIGDQRCYYDKAYEIICNDFDHNPPLPMMMIQNDDGDRLAINRKYQVLQLTLDYVRVNVSAKSYCYNQTTGMPLGISDELVYYLSAEGPFTFSVTHNNLIALGCETFAYIAPIGSSHNYVSGCASSCAIGTDLNSCAGGSSCYCEATIPEGLKAFQVEVKSLNTNRSWNPNQCSQAVVADRDFGINDLIISSRDSDLWSVPVILDWSIGGNTTCEIAQQRNPTSYACGLNTYCVNSNNVLGYNCNCSKGYQGNPYLLYGCQPIPAAAPPPKSSTSIIAKKGCRDRCGNVSIPYPFGIGSSHCYLDYQFEIRCNDSNNPPVPLLQYSKYLQSLHYSEYFNYWYEVLQLTPDYVRINVSAPAKCYNKSTNWQARSTDMSSFLLDGPFTFSNTRNKLTAVGCDIFAHITHDDHSQNNTTGCASNCSKETLGNLPSCLGGKGCCQTTIPKGLKSFLFRIDSINSTTNNRSGNPYECNNVFLMEKEFSGLEELDLSREDLYVPVIMDWAIGNIQCKKAQTNITSYVCGENTYCVESSNGPGYRCKCLDGYQGNPYLLHGCLDINECEESANICGKEGICINTQGSYTCGLDYKQGLRLAVVVPLGIGIAIILILLLAMGFWLYHRLEKRKQMTMKQNHFKRNGGLLLSQKISSNDGKVEKEAKIFLTEELERITDNFNQSRIIGKGGFGTVYKGMLSDGRIVAIKKSKLVDESQVEQFINEVVILSQINHRHIVKLLGCCLETEVPLLVYEFVSNGTLSYHLFGEAGHKSSISWKDRLRIAAEVARALAYLHSDASMPIFHRDIKSSNILLDENYKVKVSDFGISRSIPLDKTHLTTLVQGTFGYLDPEYFHSSQFTEKSDVYSFGVVLVELLTGQRAISLIRSEEEKSLAMHFISSMKENRLFEILEARVVNEGNKDEVLVVAKLAKRCLKLNGKKRPTMKEIARSLDGLRKFQENQWIENQKLQEEESCLIGDEISSYYTSGAFEVEESECSSLIVQSTAN